jgi:hypothetical protein
MQLPEVRSSSSGWAFWYVFQLFDQHFDMSLSFWPIRVWAIWHWRVLFSIGSSNICVCVCVFWVVCTCGHCLLVALLLAPPSGTLSAYVPENREMDRGRFGSSCSCQFLACKYSCFPDRHDQVSLICNTVTMKELTTAGDIDSDGTDTIELSIITRNDSRWDLLIAGKRAMLTGLEQERERERQNTLNPNPEKEREREREHICISHSFSLFLTTYTPHTHTTHTRPPAVLATRWPGHTWRFIPAIFLCNA